MITKAKLKASIPSLLRKVPEISLQNYKNSTRVMTIKGQPIFVEDIIKAALISRSNVLLLGAAGKGKTTLEHDVIDGIFGGRGIYIRAHPKMDEKELFTHLNLGKYFSGQIKSSKQLRELLSAIHNNCIIVDEITRAPGMTQNRIFGLADGYIDTDVGNGNERKEIGDGFSVLIASGNVGEEFTGTFKLDGALIDRFPVILNMDDFCPQASDTFLRLIQKHDPRVPKVVKPQMPFDNQIKDIYERVKVLEASVVMAIAVQYLVTGLGDCSKRGYPKLMIHRSMPTNCEGCSRLAEACGYHMGISERSGEAIVGFTLALQQVAVAKHEEAKAWQGSSAQLVNDDVVDVLEVFKTFFGHTGILNKQYVIQKYLGNPYLLMCDIAAKVKQEFDSKMGPLLQIIDALEKREAVSEHMLKPFVSEIPNGAGGSKLQNPWRFLKGLVGV